MTLYAAHINKTAFYIDNLLCVPPGAQQVGKYNVTADDIATMKSLIPQAEDQGWSINWQVGDDEYFTIERTML